MKDNNYIMSNSIETVSLKKFSKKEYQTVLSAKDNIKNRQIAAQSLCNKFNIPHVYVNVVNRAQPHTTSNGRLRSKTLGTYATNGVITMYNLTAVKKQSVSIKTFTHTLIHEFIHHYDYTVLKLSRSLHTTGFYKRITDLENKLS